MADLNCSCLALDAALGNASTLAGELATTSLALEDALAAAAADAGTVSLSPEEETRLLNAKIVLLAILGPLTLASSMLPWLVMRMFKQRALDIVNTLSAIAAGVIFGAFMSHMMPETAETFTSYFEQVQDVDPDIAAFPWSTVIAGAVFVILIAVDRLVVAGGIEGHHDHHDHDHVSAAFDTMKAHAAAAAAAAAASKTAAAATAPAPAAPGDRLLLEGEAGAGTTAVTTTLTTTTATTTAAAASTPDAAAAGGSAVVVNLGADDDKATAPCGAGHAHGVGHNEMEAAHRGCGPCGAWCVPSAAHSHGHGHSPAASPPGAAGSGSATTAVAHPCETRAFHSHQLSLEAREAVVRAWVFMGAMSLHALFDGLSIGAEGSWEGFVGIMVAVLVHKVFDGLAVGAAVYPAGFSWRQSAAMLAFCAIMTPVGVAIGLGATEGATGAQATLANGIVVSMSAGSFLFISISELLPAALHDGRAMAVKLAAFFLGWLALVILAGFV